jgi:thioesterase domain-containing protein
MLGFGDAHSFDARIKKKYLVLARKHLSLLRGYKGVPVPVKAPAHLIKATQTPSEGQYNDWDKYYLHIQSQTLIGDHWSIVVGKNLDNTALLIKNILEGSLVEKKTVPLESALV